MKTDRIKIYSKYAFLILTAHVLLITIFDIVDRVFDIKINYPSVSNLFILAIFILPLIGIIMFFSFKSTYAKIFGIITVLISSIDIYLFLKQTSGAL
ncbi:MAG: hypothetical protein IM600_03810 [Bacteroidetes bacterium]|nr:hypothetical protein [Bacteroidota bacterium]MCA6442535.1 hypothetical protein [Bacteroidota bacterium]